MSRLTTYAAALGRSGPTPFPWPPAKRTPYTLPEGQYDRTLPFTPPAGPEFLFVRKDGWGVTIPGLPFVPQGSSVHPDRCLTGFYNRWDAGWRQAILNAHVARGNTHFMLWLPDMLCGPGAVTVRQLVGLCEEIRARQMWIVAWLGSKDYPQWIPRDADAARWATALQPVFDALIPNDLLHMPVIGGEYDLWNLGNPSDDTPFRIAEYVVRQSQRAPSNAAVYFHFSTEKTFWGNVPGQWNKQPIRDRFDWTRLMCDLGVQGIMYQGDSGWSPNEYQGRLADSVGKLDPRWHVIPDEIMASYQFDGNPVGNEHPNELDAACLQYICCAQTNPNGQHVHGRGNGGWQSDGSAI